MNSILDHLCLSVFGFDYLIRDGLHLSSENYLDFTSCGARITFQRSASALSSNFRAASSRVLRLVTSCFIIVVIMKICNSFLHSIDDHRRTSSTWHTATRWKAIGAGRIWQTCSDTWYVRAKIHGSEKGRYFKTRDSRTDTWDQILQDARWSERVAMKSIQVSSCRTWWAWSKRRHGGFYKNIDIPPPDKYIYYNMYIINERWGTCP